MRFTPEQEAIFSTSGDIKVNAVAGSGKTTVLVEYARQQKCNNRILYLAFNRSVRMEARKRFDEQKLGNVDVQTAHSLAFRRIAIPLGYRVSKGYKIHDIVTMLSLRPSGKDIHSPLVIASHILKFAALFCNSDKARVTDIDYCATIADEQAAAAVRHFYLDIEMGVRQFLAKMDRREIDVTHDFYLKKFQLSKPALHYDIILFDEGQDASPVMLDVFMAQRARKVIVGDVHQQIYGWRHAINALRQVDFPSLFLTTSFRFNQHIAGLAMECLCWKRHLEGITPVHIHGVGTNKRVHTRATIARTNLALLKNAIDTVQHDRSVKKIYFEGNINSYTYASDGASIYDVLSLYLDNKSRIRDPLIASMRDFGELEEYADKSGDQDLGMLIDIVEEYGKEIPFLIKKLTTMHVEDSDRKKADMIFSTLHRCKGMEYDSVILTGDFINEARVRKLLEKDDEEPVDRAKVSEEINLAYVAVTRSKNFLNFPEGMFPNTDKNLFTPEKKKAVASARLRFDKSSQVGQKRQKHLNAYMPWSNPLDIELKNNYYRGRTIKELAIQFGRNQGAIRARLKKLGEQDL
jgi:F-box protein 18 (helicase)